MKGIRLYIVRGHRDALAVVRESDAVWLKRDICED